MYTYRSKHFFSTVQQYYEASYHIVSGCDQLQDLLIGGVRYFLYLNMVSYQGNRNVKKIPEDLHTLKMYYW